MTSKTEKHIKRVFRKNAAHFRGKMLITTEHLEYFKPYCVPQEVCDNNKTLSETITINPFTGVVEVCGYTLATKYHSRYKYTKGYRVWDLNERGLTVLRRLIPNIPNRVVSNETNNRFHLYIDPAIADQYIDTIHDYRIEEVGLESVMNELMVDTNLAPDDDVLLDYASNNYEVMASRDIREPLFYKWSVGMTTNLNDTVLPIQQNHITSALRKNINGYKFAVQCIPVDYLSKTISGHCFKILKYQYKLTLKDIDIVNFYIQMEEGRVWRENPTIDKNESNVVISDIYYRRKGELRPNAVMFARYREQGWTSEQTALPIYNATVDMNNLSSENAIRVEGMSQSQTFYDWLKENNKIPDREEDRLKLTIAYNPGELSDGGCVPLREIDTPYMWWASYQLIQTKTSKAMPAVREGFNLYDTYWRDETRLSSVKLKDPFLDYSRCGDYLFDAYQGLIRRDVRQLESLRTNLYRENKNNDMLFGVLDHWAQHDIIHPILLGAGTENQISKSIFEDSSLRSTNLIATFYKLLTGNYLKAGNPKTLVPYANDGRYVSDYVLDHVWSEEPGYVFKTFIQNSDKLSNFKRMLNFMLCHVFAKKLELYVDNQHVKTFKNTDFYYDRITAGYEFDEELSEPDEPEYQFNLRLETVCRFLAADKVNDQLADCSWDDYQTKICKRIGADNITSLIELDNSNLENLNDNSILNKYKLEKVFPNKNMTKKCKLRYVFDHLHSSTSTKTEYVEFEFNLKRADYYDGPSVDEFEYA